MSRFVSIAVLALAWAALCAPPTARADMIRIPRCPPGFEGRRVGHGGHCFPIACSSDASCGEGLRCARVSRCWREQRISSGRRAPQPGERPPTAWIAGALCDEEHACRGECRAARECVPRDPAATGGAVIADPDAPPGDAPATTSPSEASAPATAPAIDPPPATDPPSAIDRATEPAPAAGSGPERAPEAAVGTPATRTVPATGAASAPSAPAATCACRVGSSRAPRSRVVNGAAVLLLLALAVRVARRRHARR